MVKRYKTVLARIGKTYKYTYHQAELEPHDKIVDILQKTTNKNAQKYLSFAANRVYNNDNEQALLFLEKARTSMNNAKYPDLIRDITGIIDDMSTAAGIPKQKKKYFKV